MPSEILLSVPASNCDIHICVAATGAVANITPILDSKFKPSHVILLERKGLAEHANNLALVYQGAGVSCQRIMIENVRDADGVRDLVSELIVSTKEKTVTLNASCGHRAIMLAAFSAFQKAGQPIFYVNPEDDHLTWLSNECSSSFDLADRITIQQFLQLHGTTLTSATTDQASDTFDDLFFILITQVERFSSPFKVLNALAASAKNTDFLSQPFSSKQNYNQAIQDLVDVFSKHGCLARKGNCLVFSDEASRNFVNGGWLEVFAYRQIQMMAKGFPQIQDIAMNVELARKDTVNEVNNELDVVFLANNHLFLIECKTMDFAVIKGRMPFRKVKEKKRAAREQVYRMDSLKELHGGIYGEAMILSYHPIPKETAQRAEDLGLCICASTDLLNFKTIVRDWALPKEGRIIEDAS